MPSATLRVLANPWQHLDHEGLPAGACACDPDEHNPNRAFVGAKLKATETRKADPKRGITARHRITFEFSDEVQEVPNTLYYRRACHRGELIAADQETAKACGFKPGGFEDPPGLLASYRAKALADFEKNHGFPSAYKAPKEKKADAQKGGDK